LHSGQAEGAASTPAVSVIVPAWNAEATLAETLASVAAQRFTDIEILIVNDGSADATAAVAWDFCARDPRARLIDKPNGGVASARNAGIAVARGDWVAPIDADDLWHPDYLALLMAKALATDPAPVAVYAHCRLIDVQGRLVTTGIDLDIEGMAFVQMFCFNPVGNGSGLMFRRASVLDQGPAAGGYDTRLHAAGRQGCEDWLLQMRLAAAGPVARVPAYLVGYRMRAGSMSQNRSQMVASEAMARATLVRELELPPLPGWLWRWIRANQCVMRASAHLQRRRWGAVLGNLGLAALLVPLPTMVLLVGHVVRRIRRLLARPEAPSDMTFAEAPIAIGEQGSTAQDWYRRLQKAKLRRIARFEAGLARSPANGSGVARPDGRGASLEGRIRRP
jgi:hypothetical protein